MNIPIAASIPYFFYFYFLFIVIFFKKIKSKNQMLFLLFIIFLSIFVFYKGTYSDWRTYRKFAETCTCIGCTYFEPLYDILTYIASQTIGFKLIPFVSLFLLFSFLIKIKRYVIDTNIYFILMISIVLAYLPLYYGALRQSIAFSILLFSFMFLYNNRFLLSFMFFLVALGFHLSSIIIYILVVIYIKLYVFSKNFKYFLFLVIGTIIIGYISMLELYPFLITIDKFYVGTEAVTVNQLKLILLPLERFIILLFSLYVLYYLTKSKENSILIYYTIFSLIGAIFYLIVYKFSLNIAGRTIAFFRMGDALTIYMFFKILLNKNRSLILFNKLNGLSVLITILYLIVKYYFTIVSVGFFK